MTPFRSSLQEWRPTPQPRQDSRHTRSTQGHTGNQPGSRGHRSKAVLGVAMDGCARNQTCDFFVSLSTRALPSCYLISGSCKPVNYCCLLTRLPMARQLFLSHPQILRATTTYHLFTTLTKVVFKVRHFTLLFISFAN